MIWGIFWLIWILGSVLGFIELWYYDLKVERIFDTYDNIIGGVIFCGLLTWVFSIWFIMHIWVKKLNK